MTSLGKYIKNLPSKMTFAAVISSCLIAAAVFYDISSWLVICETRTDPKEDNVGANVARVFRRSAEHPKVVDHYQHCVVATPSKEDIQKLCAHQECTTLHCIQSCPCGHDLCPTSSRTTCLTKACTKLTVRDLESLIVHKDIDVKHLSGIVNDYLSERRNLKNLEVRCSDSNSHLFDSKLDLEITSDNSEKCTSDSDQIDDTSRSNDNAEVLQSNRTGSNIYLIFFRLISKWESFLKLPKLNSLIEHKRGDRAWDIQTFDNLQSQSFVLEQNLRSVLGLSSVSAITTSALNTDSDDLIQLAVENGKCVLFNVLACNKAEIHNELQRAVQAENNTRNCHLHQNEYLQTRSATDYTNHTFCDSSLDGKDDFEETLYIHDQLGQMFSKTTSEIFSVFVINIPDLTSTSTFDSAITDVLSQILSQESNVVMLMSDVGDPKFTRFDDSIFMRTQTFNPLLHVFISNTTNHQRPSLSQHITDIKMKENQFLTIGISNFYNLIQNLIVGENTKNETAKFDDYQINSRSDRNIQEEEKSTGACPVENIKGPVECLCQGKHVRFPNDSIQIAFASFVVGSLNNKLLELSPSNNFRSDVMSSTGSHDLNKVREFSRSRSTCDRLLGVVFSNVQHVLWKNTTYVLMTLHLTPSSRRYSHTIRLDAEVEYSTDYNYQSNFTVNILNPTKISLTSLSDSENKNSKKLIHLLCQEPNDLNRKSTSHGEFQASLSSENEFGVTAKIKSLHHPCLFLVTRSFSDSAVLEASNVCVDRLYNLSISAEFINTISLSVLPVETTIGPGEVKFITSLVKSAYWISKSAYKIKTSYTVTEI